MKATKFTVNPFGENTCLAWDEETHRAVIIDPGMMQEHERNVVTQFIEQNQLIMTHVLLTHIHIDHVASARWMADRYNIMVAANRGDEPYGKMLPMQAEHFRLRITVEALTIDRTLHHGDVIMVGNEALKVIFVPGHSAGGLAFYSPESSIAFTGDTIFNGSIGRTDLPGGDYDSLIASIRNQILTLPPDTVLIPGHGPTTTVANERDYNPYL